MKYRPALTGALAGALSNRTKLYNRMAATIQESKWSPLDHRLVSTLAKSPHRLASTLAKSPQTGWQPPSTNIGSQTCGGRRPCEGINQRDKAKFSEECQEVLSSRTPGGLNFKELRAQ